MTALMSRSVLLSWVGDADLLSWANAVGAGAAGLVWELIQKRPRGLEDAGPIKTLCDQVPFDEVHLLTDRDPSCVRRFASWACPSARLHHRKLRSPVDYEDVFLAADAVLGAVTHSESGPCKISIHLSPGTPAMAAVWLLLGKSKYPATFYQTHRGKVITTSIPFNLAVDLLPSMLRESDAILQRGEVVAPEHDSFDAVVGTSEQIRLAVARARRIAIREVGVTLLGESGVGKDVFARSIHGASSRRGGAFVPINCAAVPRELLESELFGHVKGAFTGATSDRTGAFKEADGGTLFLDEVGECDPAMQAKLLRVMQPELGAAATTRRFRRVGDSRDQIVDVRVIAATNKDLQAEVSAGKFREDLYYRLAPLLLVIPPLRDRRGDIELLAAHVLASINADFAQSEPGYRIKRLAKETCEYLSSRTWPGNVRQLQNALLQAAVMTDREILMPVDFSAADVDRCPTKDVDEEHIPDGFSLARHLSEIQRRFISRAMARARGKKTVAARMLGYTNYQTLAAQLKRLGIESE